MPGPSQACVDEEPAAAARPGLSRGGAPVAASEKGDEARLLPAATRPRKLYVEPTNQCNLNCRMCLRHVWDEPPGQMSATHFARIVAGLRAWSPPPTVFFGGQGEPLGHPDIVEMVAEVKALGALTEMITNGTLLSEAKARGLIAAGLDRLWVSLDGARPETYMDIRLGAQLPQVIANVARFGSLRRPGHRPQPEIGIAFVAMRRNIADLPALLRLGRALGATRYLVTNVLPYTAEMQEETLYQRALSAIAYLPSPWVPSIELPKMDLEEATQKPLLEIMRGGQNVSYAGCNLGHANDRCPFIADEAAAIGWDGRFSPCLPLLHDHVSFLHHRRRLSRRYVIGNVAERDLASLWEEAAHQAFRARVRAFTFSPCTFCGGCDLSEMNETDCFGNPFPTCGGCLWAQGVIRCP